MAVSMTKRIAAVTQAKDDLLEGYKILSVIFLLFLIKKRTSILKIDLISNFSELGYYIMA